jgi:hypothetical protein
MKKYKYIAVTFYDINKEVLYGRNLYYRYSQYNGKCDLHPSYKDKVVSGTYTKDGWIETNWTRKMFKTNGTDLILKEISKADLMLELL